MLVCLILVAIDWSKGAIVDLYAIRRSHADSLARRANGPNLREAQRMTGVMVLMLIEMRGHLVYPNGIDQINSWIKMHVTVGEESGGAVWLARVLMQRVVDSLLHSVVVLLALILLLNQIEGGLGGMIKSVGAMMGGG